MARRAHGEKMPQGETKKDIIMFIAQQGETQFKDIRTFANKNLFIHNLKGIRTHLEGIIKRNYIESIKPEPEEEGKYQLNIYRIKPGFDSFEHLYYLFKDEQLNEYMKSKYYRDYVKSGDLLTKLILNIAITFLTNPNNVERVYNELQKNDPTNKTSRGFQLLIFKLGKSENKHEGLKEWVEIQSGDTIDYEKYQAHLLDTIIPWNDRKTITNILLISPSSVEFIFSPEFPDAVLLSGIFNYLLYTDILSIEFFKTLIEYDTTRLRSENDKESLMLIMLRYLLASDMITRRIVKADYVEPILDELLPKTRKNDEPTANSRIRNNDKSK